MNPKHMEWMAAAVQNGSYLHCPNGSHLSKYNNQKVFFNGLIKFIKGVDTEASLEIKNFFKLKNAHQ